MQQVLEQSFAGLLTETHHCSKSSKQLDKQDVVSLEQDLNCEICAEQQFSTARCNGLLSAVLPFPSPYLTLCRTPTEAYHPVVPVKAVSIVFADIVIDIIIGGAAVLDSSFVNSNLGHALELTMPVYKGTEVLSTQQC